MARLAMRNRQRHRALDVRRGTAHRARRGVALSIQCTGRRCRVV